MTHLISIDGLAFGDFKNFIFLPIFCLLINKTDIFLAFIRDTLTIVDCKGRLETVSNRLGFWDPWLKLRSTKLELENGSFETSGHEDGFGKSER